jgi:hypothetical protein
MNSQDAHYSRSNRSGQPLSGPIGIPPLLLAGGEIATQKSPRRSSPAIIDPERATLQDTPAMDNSADGQVCHE